MKHSGSKNFKGFTLIELLVVVAIIGILAAVGVVAYNGYTSSAKKAVVKQNHKAVVKWIQADAMKCVINGGTIFRQTNNSGGGQNKDCSNVTDYNKTPFHENVLQTHIGYQSMVKNPYGSVGKDRTCDIWSGWTDMTSIQSAHLNKKMCKGWERYFVKTLTYVTNIQHSKSGIPQYTNLGPRLFNPSTLLCYINTYLYIVVYIKLAN